MLESMLVRVDSIIVSQNMEKAQIVIDRIRVYFEAKRLVCSKTIFNASSAVFAFIGEADAYGCPPPPSACAISPTS